MKQAFVLMTLIALALQMGYQWAGYEVVYQIGYGAITLMGLMISLTFLWLYVVRATPLALGMAYSWSGASLVLGWWWICLANLLGRRKALRILCLWRCIWSGRCYTFP